MSKKLLLAAFMAAFMATGGLVHATDGTENDTAGDGSAWTATVTVTDGQSLGLTSTNTSGSALSNTNAMSTAGSGTIYIGKDNTGATDSTNTVSYTTSSTLTTAGTGGVTVGKMGTLKVDDTSTIGTGTYLTVEAEGTTVGTVTLGAVNNDGTITNDGTVNFTGALDNNTAITNAGTMAFTGTVDNDGTITNSGLMTYNGANAYTGSGGINNSATKKAYVAGDVPDDGFQLTMGTNEQSVVAGLIVGDTDVGDVILNGIASGGLTFTGATDGNVYLNGDADDNTIDAQGANLILTATSDATDSSLAGHSVIFDKADAYTNSIIAWGDSGDYAAKASADGIIRVNEDGTSFDLDLNGGTLDIRGTTTLATTASFTGNNIALTGGTTLTNMIDTAANLDLSGGELTGVGTLDNTAGKFTLKGAPTTLDSTFKIDNSGAGEIVTDQDAVLALDTNDTLGVKTAGNGGFGTLTVESGLDAGTDGLDWSNAGDGVMVIAGDGTASTVNNVKLGGGTLWLEDAIGSANVITLTGTNSAALLAVVTDGINDSDFTGSVDVDGGATLTNTKEHGVLNVGHDEDFTVDGVLNNAGKINFGDNTTFAGGGMLNNYYLTDDGTINADATNTNIDDLAALLNASAADGGNAESNIGIVNLTGDLGATFNVTNAEKGIVTLSGTQTLGESVDVNGADLILSGADNNTTGTFRGGNVTISGTNGIYNGTITGTKGVLVSSTNTFNETVTATAGNIEITAAGNKFLNGITTNGIGSYTTLANGKDVTLAGDLQTDFRAGNGSTVRVGNTPLNIDGTNGGSLTMDSSTLAFEGTNPIQPQITGDGVLSITSDTTLWVDRDSIGDGETRTLIDDTTRGVMSLDGNDTHNTAWDTALDTYLESQGFLTLAESGVYDVVDGDIVYTFNKATRADENLDTILGNQGILGYKDMISDSTLQSQFEYSRMSDTDLAAITDPRQRYLAELIKSAAGDTRFLDLTGKPVEAYALEQWKNGADIAGALEAVTDTARQFNRAMTSRSHNYGRALGYDECGRPVENCAPTGAHIWAGYSGMWDKNKGRNWDKGYDYDAHGVNVGLDFLSSSGFTFGAAFGYSKGDYENRGNLGDDSDINNYSFGLYGTYNHASGFFTTLSGTYTYSKYKMNSTFANYASTAAQGFTGVDRAKFSGNTWSFGGKVGYDLKAGERLTITPSVGLYYYDSSTDSFNSNYRRGLKYSRNDFELPVDVTVKYDVVATETSTISLVATGGYAYNFSNKGTKIAGFNMADSTGNTFGDYRFVKPGRNSWNVGGGVQFRHGKFDFGAQYEYYGRKDHSSHNVSATVGVSF